MPNPLCLSFSDYTCQFFPVTGTMGDVHFLCTNILDLISDFLQLEV